MYDGLRYLFAVVKARARVRTGAGLKGLPLLRVCGVCEGGAKCPLKKAGVCAKG